MNQPARDNGVLTIYAAYTDNGGNNTKPLMGSGSAELRSSKMTFEGVTKMEGYSKATFGGKTFLIIPAEGWFRIDSIDLFAITKASIMMGWQKPPVAGYTFEVHLDSPTGQKIGEFTFAGKNGPAPKDAKPQFAVITSSISPVNDGKMHNIYIVSKIADPSVKGMAALSSIEFFVK
jgi:hypothetical protein